MRLVNLKTHAGVRSGRLEPGHSPERIEAERERQLAEARRICPEAPFSDFDIVKSGPAKLLFVDRATGVQYRKVGYVVDPATAHLDNLACHIVDAGGSVHYLRRRGEKGTPLAVGLPGAVYGREVKPGSLPAGDDWRVW